MWYNRCITPKEALIRKLKIDLSLLASALESSFEDDLHYLDLETGEIVFIDDDTQREVERI